MNRLLSSSVLNAAPVDFFGDNVPSPLLLSWLLERDSLRSYCDGSARGLLVPPTALSPTEDVDDERLKG